MLGAAGAGCGSSTAPPARLNASVMRAEDTVRFQAPAAASRCGRPKFGLLLHGSEGGNGVLIWLRSASPLTAGEFPLLTRADTDALRGATVAVRFGVGEAAHGVTLDSGGVAVTQTEPALSARARGSGLDAVGVGRLAAGGAGRVALDASFESVPLGADTVACQVQPW